MRRPHLRSAWLVVLALPFLGGWSFFDPFHAHVEKGNGKAKKGDAPAAVEEYDQAARVNPSSPIPDFNKGVALARGGQADSARDAFLAAAASRDHKVAADALYNAGNVLLGQQKPGEAVEDYLKSLDLDPADADARRNLEIALRRLQQQQQQQQQQPKDQKDDKDKKDQKQDQKQDQPQDQKKDQKQQPKDEKQNEPPKPQPAPGDSMQAPQDRMSKEDAERLLNAIQSDELKVLGQVRRQDGGKEVTGNDW